LQKGGESRWRSLKINNVVRDQGLVEARGLTRAERIDRFQLS